MRLLIGIGACVVASACSTAPGGHFDARVWGNALHTQLERPDQLAIEGSLLAATIAIAPFDRRIQRDSFEDQTVTAGKTSRGDAVAVGLGVAAVGVGAGEWIGGDQGHATEVLVESFLVTDGLTELLKRTTNRRRPAGGNGDSFPSGHTSFSFTMATFLQRRIADSCDGWVGDLGYLLYLPAAYVGVDRSEANRHWPTDVTFGAFLGVLCTNVVYDAHYGAPGQPGLFGVKGLRVEPEVVGDHAEVGMVLRF